MSFWGMFRRGMRRVGGEEEEEGDVGVMVRR